MVVTREELEKLNPKKNLVEKAKKFYGKTYDCREAGYIMEDGTMLDLSGKKEGGTPKTRSLDHRDVCRVIDTSGKGASGGQCMNFFERRANAIRFGLYGTWKRGYDIIAQLNTYQKPTEKQWKRIEKCCRLFKLDAMSYDVYDENGNRIISKTKDNPDCKKAIEQIKRDLESAKKD